MAPHHVILYVVAPYSSVVAQWTLVWLFSGMSPNMTLKVTLLLEGRSMAVWTDQRLRCLEENKPLLPLYWPKHLNKQKIYFIRVGFLIVPAILISPA